MWQFLNIFEREIQKLKMKTLLPILFLSISMCAQQSISGNIINENLDNYSFRESAAEIGVFRGKVYSVKYYSSDAKGQKKGSDKLFDGTKMYLEDHTLYRKDGRRSFSREISGNDFSTSKYYYDKSSGNLVLKEDHLVREYGTSHYSKWFFYDDQQVISEEVGIEKNKTKTKLSNYTRYTTQDSAMQKKIIISEVGYDSISNPDKIYTFNKENLIKISPLYQSKTEKLSLINGIYKVYEIIDYVIEGRKVYFKYDKKGNVISEIWYKENGLENKIEFTYNTDYTESVQINYHLLGSQVSSKTYKKYDEYGNITFDQTHYYDGSIGSLASYEYQYDKEGNWIVKKSFYSEANKGILGTRKLISTTTREIDYYTETTQEQNAELPKMPEIINEIRKNMPQIAKVKDAYLEEKKEVIQAESYDAEITVKQSEDLKDFTPKYWELREIAYGNLDEDDQDEAVAVYKMPSVDHEDAKQVLAIFKKENGKWKITHQTSSTLLSSQSGGMMGNPFNGISISKKSIVIKHFGGSRDKWEYVHRYRFQNNDWYLIGASARFGAPCDYWVSFDYNLSTGDATYNKKTEQCENQKNETADSQKTNKKIPLPKMDEFIPGDNSFKFPKVKNEIYY